MSNLPVSLAKTTNKELSPVIQRQIEEYRRENPQVDDWLRAFNITKKEYEEALKQENSSRPRIPSYVSNLG